MHTGRKWTHARMPAVHLAQCGFLNPYGFSPEQHNRNQRPATPDASAKVAPAARAGRARNTARFATAPPKCAPRVAAYGMARQRVDQHGEAVTRECIQRVSVGVPLPPVASTSVEFGRVLVA